MLCSEGGRLAQASPGLPAIAAGSAGQCPSAEQPELFKICSYLSFASTGGRFSAVHLFRIPSQAAGAVLK